MEFELSLEERIENFIISNMREEYPYMHIEAVHSAAEASVNVVKKTIQEQ